MRIKKRIGRVSCGTLQAIGKAATEVSHLSPREVKERNDSVNKQLQNNNIYSVNVAGDGNCFFRAVSFNLFGDEYQHSELRKVVCNKMLYDADVTAASDASPADSDFISVIHSHIASMGRDITEVGEDVIAATAEHFQREIHLYFASVIGSPRVFFPSLESFGPWFSPILLAFYEPGHFKAVAKIQDARPAISPTSISSSTLSSLAPSSTSTTSSSLQSPAAAPFMSLSASATALAPSVNYMMGRLSLA